jgi:hypothetical protein
MAFTFNTIYTKMFVNSCNILKMLRISSSIAA